jgi:DNA-binding NarL/FixJ family response regulator
MNAIWDNVLESTILGDISDAHQSPFPSQHQAVRARVERRRLNKQVGGEHGITEITVNKHRGRVMEKMQARSVADLVKFSASLGGLAADLRSVLTRRRVRLST